MRSEFWQLAMEPGSIEKMAFVCHAGKLNVWDYHLALLMLQVFTSKPWTKCSVNLLVSLSWCLSMTFDLFKKLTWAQNSCGEGPTETSGGRCDLKDSKCHWAKSEIELLGYVVSAQGILAQPLKSSAIKALKNPTNISELCRFLGMTGYYRQFIPGYAQKASVLYALMQKDAKWQWTEEEAHAFESLKLTLCDS